MPPLPSASSYAYAYGCIFCKLVHGEVGTGVPTAHFNSDSHLQADMTVMVIDQVYNHDPYLHKTQESRWIRTLRTLSLLGMNLWVDSL